MSREQLIAEARAAARSAKHNLKWIRKHPDRIDQAKVPDMEEYLNHLIMFSRYEKENARRLGRTSLRTRLKELVVSILPHWRGQVKEKETVI